MVFLGRLKVILGCLGVALVVSYLVPVSAASANISHSFNTSTSIRDGSLVSLDPKKSDYVIPANTSNGKQLVGVVVISDDSLLAVDSGASTGRVQVATSGSVNSLVSTLNGNIKVGDAISVSFFNGVGAREIAGARVIGIAQTALNTTSDGAKQETITDTTGTSKQIAVGYVKLSISLNASSAGGGNDLNGLQRFAASLTGRTVSTLRIVISLVVTLVTFLALISLIYSSIYGGILSIGRNPLAKYAVFRTLLSVLGIAIAMSAVAAVLVYFLLH